MEIVRKPRSKNLPQIKLKNLAAGVCFTPTYAPFSLMVKLPDGKVMNLPSFTIDHGVVGDHNVEVMENVEIIVPTGTYDPTNRENGYLI
jgi:hypothetical protein